MMAIIRSNLWQRRWFILWWCLGVAAFIALEICFYPALKGQTAQLNKSFSQIPASVKSFIGDSGDYFSPTNYLNSRVFYLVIPILFAVLMIGLGSSLLAREEQDGTLELLLSRPISRSRLLAGKAMSGLVITGSVALAGLFVCVGLSKAVGLPNSVAEISAAMLLSYLMCLVFGAFAFMLSAIGQRARALSIGLTTFVFVASYAITGFTATIAWAKWPARFLPYYYFNPQRMLTGHFTWGPVLGYAAAILLYIIIARLGFQKRDIG